MPPDPVSPVAALVARWKQMGQDFARMGTYGGQAKAWALKKCANELDAALGGAAAARHQQKGRVDDSQYDQPLATASENTPVPTAAPYRVEVEREGCECCGDGKQWEVYDADGVGIGGITFGTREEAEHLAEMLNDAYAAGQRAVRRSPAPGGPER